MCKTKNVRNYDSGKVAKFQDAKLSGFGVNLKKPQGGGGIHPPPRPNRVNPSFTKRATLFLQGEGWINLTSTSNQRIISNIDIFCFNIYR